MPITKMNSIESDRNSQATRGPNPPASAAVAGGYNNDFNDPNLITQNSLGRARSTTQDMGRGQPKLTINNSNPVHFQENVKEISLD